MLSNSYKSKKIPIKSQILIASAILAILPMTAFAGTDVSSLSNALNGLINILTGTVAKGICVISILGIGYMTALGKLSFKLGLNVCLGIGIIFGAQEIATILGVSG